MSQDLGAGPSGFVGNFAYGTISLSNNTYVQLLDQFANAPGGGNQALYVNTLIVPAGSTR